MDTLLASQHERPGLRRGAWTEEEDTRLRRCMEKYGTLRWCDVPARAGLNRCRKSCRLRWLNYLNPSIKRGKFEEEEEDLIIRLHKLLGNRWSLIAGRIPGRTANDIKNYWNTHLSKRNAVTNKPKQCGGKTIRPQPQSTASKDFEVIRPQPQTIRTNWSWSRGAQMAFGEHWHEKANPPPSLSSKDKGATGDGAAIGYGGLEDDALFQIQYGDGDCGAFGEEGFLIPGDRDWADFLLNMNS